MRSSLPDIDRFSIRPSNATRPACHAPCLAVAPHLQPEILIVDEVLASATPPFRKKSGKMSQVSRDGRTVFRLAQHGRRQNLCSASCGGQRHVVQEGSRPGSSATI